MAGSSDSLPLNSWKVSVFTFHGLSIYDFNSETDKFAFCQTLLQAQHQVSSEDQQTLGTGSLSPRSSPSSWEDQDQEEDGCVRQVPGRSGWWVWGPWERGGGSSDSEQGLREGFLREELLSKLRSQR